jgi:hypothetical protein
MARVSPCTVAFAVTEAGKPPATIMPIEPPHVSAVQPFMLIEKGVANGVNTTFHDNFLFRALTSVSIWAWML